MQLLAKDGIYLRIAPRAVQQGVLASGNRADLLLNCPAGNYTFNSAKLTEHEQIITDNREALTGTLLNIIAGSPGAVASPGAPHQCDLPVFKVNRPCCC